MYQTCQENLPKCGDSRYSIPTSGSRGGGGGERETKQRKLATLNTGIIGAAMGPLTSSETRFGREILDDLTNWNMSITPSVFTLSS